MSLSIYIFGVFIVVFVMLSSYFLGERSQGHNRAGVYESGIKGTGSSNIPYFANYFMLAILFVIFDMESVFIYLWSISIRELGWDGFLKMSLFIGMLILGLVYTFKLGVLNLVKPSRKELNND